MTMSENYKFDYGLDKKPYKPNECERSFIEELELFAEKIDFLINSKEQVVIYRSNPKYFSERNGLVGRVSNIILKLKENMINGKIFPKMLKIVANVLDENLQKITDSSWRIQGASWLIEKEFFISMYENDLMLYNTVKACIEPLEAHLKNLIEEDKVKQAQIKILASVSKEFLSFNGIHAVFKGGYFGENFTLAETIFDYLNLTQKAKERFYLESSPANDSLKPNDTPKEKLKKENQSFNK